MEQLLKNIHLCNNYERELMGARQMVFQENLLQWRNAACPEQQNNHFFVPVGDISSGDIQKALEFQKNAGSHYLMLRTSAPLNRSLVAEFGFEETCTQVMALLQDTSEGWRENPLLEIRDIQTSDISQDLLDVSDVPEKYQAQALNNLQILLDVTKTHPEYHWLCGYLDGKKVANVYALCHSGCIEVDDLWVHRDFRNRYIATTLLKYIAKELDGTLYLHAEADKTPKEMYARMGFETVERNYDYCMEW